MAEEKRELAQMSVRDLMGLSVVDANADDFGKIEDIHLDVKEGRVSSIVIKTGGLRRERFEIKPEEIEKVGDRVILNVVRESIIERTQGRKVQEEEEEEEEK